MLRRFCFLMALWTVAVLPAFGQVLRGQVTTPEGEVLPTVQVVLPDLQRGTITDDTGRYVLAGLPRGTHAVEFRFVGFRTERRTVTLGEAAVTLDVVLAPEPAELDEVLVTAEEQAEAMLRRSTHSVTVLDAETLEGLRGQTLGETLRELPGVTTLSTGPSIAKPVVRGLHSQRLVVLNAGVPQEGQQWGGEHAPEIDPFAPARIEVIRGAAGVEHGIGAIGGVIRLERPSLPASAPVRGRLLVNGFSNNRQGAGSLYLHGGPRAVPGLGWRLQTSLRKAGDARTPNHVVGNSAFEQFDAAVDVGYQRDRYRLKAYASHFGTELGLFRGAHIGNVDDLLRAIERGEPAVAYDFSYGIDAPKQTIAHDLLTLRGEVRLGSGDWLEAQYGLQRNRRAEFDAHCRFCDDPGAEPAFRLTLTTQSLDVKLRQRPRGGFLGVVGVSGMSQGNVNGETGYLIPNFRALTGGVFARETYVRGPLTLEAGARFDYRWMRAFPRERLSQGAFVERIHRFASLSSVLGAIWRFREAWSVAANLGTAWRPPGVNELYNFGVHHGTAQFETGNPGLDGERSYNADVTLRHLGERSRLEVSVFNNRMQDYIFLFPEDEPRVTIRGTFPAFRYAQTDAVLRGFDGSIGYDVAPFLTLSAVASVVRGRDREADDDLIFMPSDRLTLQSEIHLPDAGLFRENEMEIEALLVREQDRFPEGVDFADPPPGYTLLGFHYRTALQVGAVPVRLSLEVENLLNTSYRDYLSRFRYFIDDPGRSLTLRLQVPINGDERY
ncbi:MAG: TonB-dependent receptor [Rhodothermales bacterium]|nr:TonB-dependent receptor [Rhodothermales bacterium]